MIASKTDIGMKREKNEDYCVCSSSSDGKRKFLILADGMGGHNCGDVAGRIAVNYVREKLEESDYADEDITDAIYSAICDANNFLLNYARENINTVGMGTTIVVAVVSEDKAYIGHVGDSRAYIITKDEIEQITKDHSYIEELLDRGYISEEEARNHPQKNIVTQALGSSDGVKPEINIVDLSTDDTILLCSDGLTNMVSDTDIFNIILSSPNQETACDLLIKAANDNGGLDNITVAVFKNCGEEPK